MKARLPGHLCMALTQAVLLVSGHFHTQARLWQRVVTKKQIREQQAVYSSIHVGTSQSRFAPKTSSSFQVSILSAWRSALPPSTTSGMMTEVIKRKDKEAQTHESASISCQTDDGTSGGAVKAAAKIKEAAGGGLTAFLDR